MTENDKPLSLASRIQSIRYALSGIATLLKNEPNARIHALATIAVIVVGILVEVTPTDWCFLILAIAIVWLCEAFNTAIEAICDLVSPEFHPQIKIAKDVAAGAVLLSAVAALLIGLSIFVPHLPAL